MPKPGEKCLNAVSAAGREVECIQEVGNERTGCLFVSQSTSNLFGMGETEYSGIQINVNGQHETSKYGWNKMGQYKYNI